MKARPSGFTLVELLIVVAIIGVLSTIGIPTFRRMIQKAKKAEAKLHLGGIYKAEAAFYAEHSLYGNNISYMGFEPEGWNETLNAHPGNYVVGFFEEGVDPALCIVNEEPGPVVGTPMADKLFKSQPEYFNASKGNRRYPAAIMIGNCLPSQLGADGISFRATATGSITPKYDVMIPGALDKWSINDQRILANEVDGLD